MKISADRAERPQWLLPPAQSAPASNRAATRSQADNEQDQEYHEQDLGNTSGSRGNSSKPEDCRYDRDDEKYPCVPKHWLNLPLVKLQTACLRTVHLKTKKDKRAHIGDTGECARQV